MAELSDSASGSLRMARKTRRPGCGWVMPTRCDDQALARCSADFSNCGRETLGISFSRTDQPNGSGMNRAFG